MDRINFRRIKRLIGFIAVFVLSALLVTPVAMAGERKAAERAARQAASMHVENFGIFYPSSQWEAKCRRKRASWKCEVQTDNGQCGGVLRVQKRRSGGFKAYHERIGCGE